MPLTPRLGLPIPLGTDPATVPTDLNEFATALESGTYAEGLTVDRPVAEKKGRLYRATDTGIWWGDTGTGWAQVGGPHAAQHSPGGADPLPAAPVGVVTRGDTLGYSGATTIVWQGPASPYWSAASPNQIRLPHMGAWLVQITADPILGPSPRIACSATSNASITGASQHFIGVASWLAIAEGANASAIFEIRPNGDGNASGFTATAAHIG